MTQDTNPLLARIQLPGETFRLPSGGLFYHDKEFDESVKAAEVVVHPMTALDEICLKTPDLLLSGKAVEQVFNRCIPQINEPMNLLAKDVDYLLACLRYVSYGDKLEIKYTHKCENAKEHDYIISVNDMIKKSKTIDPTTINSLFKLTLDNAQVVSIKPVRYVDYVKVLQLTEFDETLYDTPEAVRDLLIDSVVNVIAAVDEISDIDMIKEWLRNVPPSLFKAINKKITKTVDWGPMFSSQVVCRDCNKKTKVEVPFNPISFFT